MPVEIQDFQDRIFDWVAYFNFEITPDAILGQSLQ